MRELLAHHGEVKLWHDHGGVVNNFTVTVGPADRWVFTATNRDAARDAANTAWKALADNPTDPEAVATAAVLVPAARAAATDWANEYGKTAADWLPEVLNGTVNVHLGMCPDGCCGGGEVLEGEELAEWAAWRVRLNAAVKAAVHAPA